MSLEDLNEQLHGRDAHLDRARLTPQEDHTAEEIAREQVAFQQADDWRTAAPKVEKDVYIVNPKSNKRKKILRWSLGILGAALVLGAAAFAAYTFFQRQSAVGIKIEGPQNVASAEPVSFTVIYTNDSWSEISDATLSFTLPNAFHPDTVPGLAVTGRKAEVKIGTVAPGTAGKFLLPGKFYGSKGEEMTLEAVLRYTPLSTSSHFESKAVLPLIIATSPLQFEIDAPLELVSGQELDYVITYENRSNETFNNLRVVLEYPAGFQFMSADQKMESGENSWYFPALAPKQSGKIVVHGLLSGSRDEFKRIKGEIGIRQGDATLLVYNSAERATKMIASPLSISQTVNGKTNVTVLPGDTLSYSIKYRNDAEIGLRDVIITQSIDTTYLDVSRLKLSSGAYDPATKKIIWRASDIQGLAKLSPGEGGELSFSIPVLDAFDLNKDTGSSIAIRSIATIDSPDVPAITAGNKIIGSNVLLVKLGALIGFQVIPFYTDVYEPNSGPVPPMVGQETTYTIRLRVDNSSNDLTQSRVLVAFPSGVSYKGKSFPRDAVLSFNERTNEVTWDMGTVSPGTPRELSFQVSITPNASQAGAPVDLVRRAVFTAKDTFTNREVRSEKGATNNQLGDAETGSQKSGQVLR